MLGEEDKRLVQSHKSLNLQLRRQLQSLNIELDRLLLLKTSTVPKKQIPSISEYLHSNPKILQSQCDNLSKRLEQINRDKLSLKKRSQIDYNEQEKTLLKNLSHLKNQREELEKTVRSAESNLNKPTQKDSKDMYQRLERVTKELTLFRNIERELMKQISIQEVQQIKLEGKMQQIHGVHDNRGIHENQLIPRGVNPISSQHQKNINSDYSELYFTLRSLEAAKLKEEAFLKFQNRSMLTEIDLLEGKTQKKRQRNYSTIDSSKKRTDRYKQHSDLLQT